MDEDNYLLEEWSLDEYHSDDAIQPTDCSLFKDNIVAQNSLHEISDLPEFSETATIQSLTQLHSIHGSESSGSEDEIESAHIQAINGEVNFRLHQSFASIDDFYEAVKSYGVQNMYNLSFVKKDKVRCRVKCVKNCPWLIYCSKVGNLQTYQVKTFISSHNCQKEGVKANFADTKWLGKKVIEDFREHPKMTGEELKDLIYKKHNVNISISKAYRVKAYAMQSLDGNVVEQYSRLPDYCEELLKTNPGSTAILIARKHGQRGPTRFDRIYICIDACKKGFLAGCRPLIAIDGCHLSGYYRGQLLAAIGLDGNNGMFIIAYAIVSSETRETWQWFLQNLITDIGQMSIRGERWTFISDQGKGIVAALEELYPSPYHRFCVRHMYTNFQKKWKDEQVRSLFWLAAKSTTVSGFERHMGKLKDKEYSAWEHLTKIGVERWSRAHFQNHVKCHVFSSSIVECFNGVIKRYRDNHVDILIDNIRIKSMTLMQRKKEKMKLNGGLVCPEILKKLNECIMESTRWRAISCGEVIFEVTLWPKRFVVHLQNNTCTCRLWDLTGVPCVHACAAIQAINGRAENYVHEYFTQEFFFRAYEHEVVPMGGPNFWPKSDNERIQPPLLRRPPGRPKKQRHKSSLERKDPHKAKRKYGMIKCGKCRQLGHNKRSCKENDQEIS